MDTKRTLDLVLPSLSSVERDRNLYCILPDNSGSMADVNLHRQLLKLHNELPASSKFEDVLILDSYCPSLHDMFVVQTFNNLVGGQGEPKELDNPKGSPLLLKLLTKL